MSADPAPHRSSQNCTSYNFGRRPARPWRPAALALTLLLPAAAQAQGFANLGTEAEGFALPDPAYALAFPTDHGPHSDFRIERWYLTANLVAADGTPYGLQWTLFRSALAPGGEPDSQLWMAHAAVTTPDAHFVAERLARGGIGQAGVTADPFDAWLDEWRLSGDLSGNPPSPPKAPTGVSTRR